MITEMYNSADAAAPNYYLHIAFLTPYYVAVVEILA